MGLVLDKDDYKQRYCANLPKPTNPAVYNETIPKNATNVVHSKVKAIHTAKIVSYLLFVAAKIETCDFILAVIEDRGVRHLQEPITFYTAVSPFKLLAHLQTVCGCLHALDVLALKNEMQN